MCVSDCKNTQCVTYLVYWPLLTISDNQLWLLLIWQSLGMNGIQLTLMNLCKYFSINFSESFLAFPKKFCVQLLSEEDGRADIVATTKRIAADFADNNIEEKHINIDHINKSLKGLFQVTSLLKCLEIQLRTPNSLLRPL